MTFKRKHISKKYKRSRIEWKTKNDKNFLLLGNTMCMSYVHFRTVLNLVRNQKQKSVQNEKREDALEVGKSQRLIRTEII